jgi:predicted RNase H-like nuclease (RuvC/YqgF family)
MEEGEMETKEEVEEETEEEVEEEEERVEPAGNRIAELERENRELREPLRARDVEIVDLLREVLTYNIRGITPAGESPRARDESPRAYDESPRAYGEFPYAYDESPYAYDESPYAYDESPRARDDRIAALERENRELRESLRAGDDRIEALERENRDFEEFNRNLRDANRDLRGANRDLQASLRARDMRIITLQNEVIRALEETNQTKERLIAVRFLSPRFSLANLCQSLERGRGQ